MVSLSDDTASKPIILTEVSKLATTNVRFAQLNMSSKAHTVSVSTLGTVCGLLSVGVKEYKGLLSESLITLVERKGYEGKSRVTRQMITGTMMHIKQILSRNPLLRTRLLC